MFNFFLFEKKKLFFTDYSLWYQKLHTTQNMEGVSKH